MNGAKVAVDVEEFSEQEIKALTKQKRVKPPRIPWDQPLVDRVIRRRRWSAMVIQVRRGVLMIPEV